jgi:hypothetical protein
LGVGIDVLLSSRTGKNLFLFLVSDLSVVYAFIWLLCPVHQGLKQIVIRFSLTVIHVFLCDLFE